MSRVCAHCKASLEGRRADVKHCGGACRTAAWRGRGEATAEQAALAGMPFAAAKAALARLEADGRMECVHSDDGIYRWRVIAHVG